jgi:predicted RNase H-like HicB family nuclease
MSVAFKGKRTDMAISQKVKLVIERTEDGYVAYPLGLKGIIVAEGDTYEEVLQSIRSAVRFHIETFGEEAFDEAVSAREVFIAETEVAVG